MAPERGKVLDAYRCLMHSQIVDYTTILAVKYMYMYITPDLDLTNHETLTVTALHVHRKL
jgi:hypothetical protein